MARIPSFSLSDQVGRVWKEADLNSKWTVLYVYPKDMTSGCTIEAHDFIRFLPEFQKLGVQVLGLSPDDTKSHKKFCDKDGITYPLLVDTEKKLIQALDAWKEKSLYGKNYMGVERSTWIIKPKGEIMREWRKVNVPGHVEEVLMACKTLIQEP